MFMFHYSSKFGILGFLAAAGMLSVLPMARAQTVSSAGSSMRPSEVQAKIHEIDALVASHGGTISPIKLTMRRVVDAEGSPHDTNARMHAKHTSNSADCTATATVSVSGSITVTLSPTAPNCTAAVGMLAKGVRTYLQHPLASRS